MLIMRQLTAALALVLCAEAFMKRTLGVCTQSEKIKQRGASFEGGHADG